MGRRSCMGYKMVQNVAYSLVASLLQHFTFSSEGIDNGDLPLGMLALPPSSFNLKLKRRNFLVEGEQQLSS
jgi:cytochrome P450 family 307 subfamily A